VNREIRAGLGLMLLSVLVSCTGSLPVRPSDTPPQPGVMADTFFSGCAYLDENSNEAIDPEDPLLGGMMFTVTLAGGTGFGGDTSGGQCAFITVPAALPTEAWPILARMVVPEGAGYEPIGPSEVTLEYRQTRANFLLRAE
jgi:hypothetical protein